MSENKQEPQQVPTGRMQRMFKIGKLGASIGASKLSSKIREALGSDTAEETFLNKSADRIVSTLGSLKGASMKVGQFLSSDPELLPEGLAERLTSLQNNAPPMTFDTISSQIEKAFGLPIDAIFSYFSAEPIGAASIGQVHRATLADTGQDVAVKVQYPAVVESLDNDLKSLESLLNFGRVLMSAQRKQEIIEEIRSMVIEESDYRKEAQNLQTFNEICDSREKIRIPKPIHEWTRKTVLTMEFMEGEKLDKALTTIEDPDRKNELLYRWVTTYVWMFHEVHYMHADPHPGNFLLAEDDTIVILDFGSVKKFRPEFTDSILEILDTVWQDDPYRALDIYERMGFGSGGFDIQKLDPEVIRKMHLVILEPYYTREPFHFGTWKPAREKKRLVMEHPSLLRLIPPAEFIQYLRLLSGVKGLLARFDGSITITELVAETARRHNKLTAEPLWSKLAAQRAAYLEKLKEEN